MQTLKGRGDSWLHPVDCAIFLADPDRYLGPFDQTGLPMQVFGQAPPVYVPSRTAAFAFAHWNAWRLGGNAEHLEPFLKAARWFADFPDGRIEHPFDLIEMSAPWLSGLAQGEALSVLARAHLVEPDTGWLQMCEPIFTWLETPVAEGGVLDRLPDGSPFLEEYPGSRHRHVLNGCLYALVGIDDWRRFEENDRASELFHSVIDSVERNIGHWEYRGWSLYEYRDDSRAAGGNFNTPAYQRVHIALLDYLAQRARSQILADAADRLRIALNSLPRRVSALTGKIRYRLKAGW